ncbi:MAG: Rieske (2Fe-2S) protein [Carbonactinosporaceae bacterium]
MSEELTRRTVLRHATVAGVLGAAGAAAAGCGAGEGGSGGGSGGEPSPEGDKGDGGGVYGLAPTTEVPVGGGTVFDEQRVVVTQPREGEFKGFSATCTHRGCTVARVEGGTINCPCHGSRFSISDGSVQGGPALEPLPAARIQVRNGQIRLV